MCSWRQWFAEFLMFRSNSFLHLIGVLLACQVEMTNAMWICHVCFCISSQVMNILIHKRRERSVNAGVLHSLCLPVCCPHVRRQLITICWVFCPSKESCCVLYFAESLELSELRIGINSFAAPSFSFPSQILSLTRLSAKGSRQG